MIVATFDLLDGWAFDGEPSNELGIRFADGDAARIFPQDLAFGYSAIVNGLEAGSVEWPPSNVTIRELTPARVFPYQLEALPDDEVLLIVWASNAGVHVDAEFEFTVPRPAQPFPSWSWKDGRWVPPVAYPGDGELYSWDEELLGWAVIENG
jgi:hypothetical protein